MHGLAFLQTRNSTNYQLVLSTPGEWHQRFSGPCNATHACLTRCPHVYLIAMPTAPPEVNCCLQRSTAASRGQLLPPEVKFAKRQTTLYSSFSNFPIYQQVYVCPRQPLHGDEITLDNVPALKAVLHSSCSDTCTYHTLVLP